MSRPSLDQFDPLSSVPPPPSTSRNRTASSSSFGDFGDFHTAPSSTTDLPTLAPPPNRTTDPLGSHDLLGSFDDLTLLGKERVAARPVDQDGAVKRTEQRRENLLGEFGGSLKSGAAGGDPRLQPYTGPSAPHLPPPPTSTSSHTNWNPFSLLDDAPTSPRPPIRAPPRRLSMVQSSFSPSSPPAVTSDAGDSFIFRARAPSHDEGPKKVEDAEQGMRRLSISPTRSFLGHSFGIAGAVGHFPRKKTSADNTSSGSKAISPTRNLPEKSQTLPRSNRLSDSWDFDPYAPEAGPSSSSPRRDSFTSKTAKIVKSKWKTVIGPSTFTPQDRSESLPTGIPNWNLESDAPVKGKLVQTTHDNPFGASGEYGSYVAPSGAPGFAGRLGEVWSQNGNVKGKESANGSAVTVEPGSMWSGTKLLGRRETTVKVLLEHEADLLRPYLPPRPRLSSTWKLLFSLDQHGASLATFYRLIAQFTDLHPTGGNMLVIKDTEGRRFGAFLNEGIRKSEGYIGSGESWLFKLIGEHIDIRAKVFKWTGRNHYFALCQDFISFGGGDGVYGLYLDAKMVDGSSARCMTYGNEPLCLDEGVEGKGKFEVLGVEVWGVA